MEGELTREDADLFLDHWTQPRLFWNSLSPVEKQHLVDAIRFETSNVKSETVRKNVVAQLNKVAHEIAARVAPVIGVPVPEPDPTYYHNDTTKGISVDGQKVSIAGQKVGILASVEDEASLSQAAELKEKFAADKVNAVVVGERLDKGVDMTYSATRSIAFDGVIVAEGAEKLFDPSTTSALYPAGRPVQVIDEAYRWGKPVGTVGSASSVYESTVVKDGPGVYAADDASAAVDSFKEGLAEFKFMDRFTLDEDAQGGNSTANKY